MHQNTRAIASIWRWERVAARSVSARRISQKRALNGHFLTTKGRLAVNWGFESAKFCDKVVFQGRLPSETIFWSSSMKKWNRPQIGSFFYQYKLNPFHFVFILLLVILVNSNFVIGMLKLSILIPDSFSKKNPKLSRWTLNMLWATCSEQLDGTIIFMLRSKLWPPQNKMNFTDA